MTGSGSRPRARDLGGSAAVALVVTLAIQVYTSLAATATMVLVPEIARDLALPATLIGLFVGLVYAGSMAAGLASGAFIGRYGAIRVSQVCVLFCAAGIALVATTASVAAVPAALLALLVGAPVVMGWGYGPITPASSQVLARTAPPSQMALTFSLKQTGVPVGAALAGAALPAIALAWGWRNALWAVSLAGIAVAIVAQPTRRALDADRDPTQSLSLASLVGPLRLVLSTPVLVELALTALVYAAMQVCLMSYLVVYLNGALGFSLVLAGLGLTIANIGGIVGRIGWGMVADRYVPPRRLLGLLGLAAGAGAGVTATFGPGWPLPAVLAVCAAFGATAIGWNGVQLAEVARHAPAGRAGAVTGAVSFVTFGGVVVGPPTFALLAAVTGSYRAGFVAFGSLSALLGLWLLLSQRR
jgi:MFS family permease